MSGVSDSGSTCFWVWGKDSVAEAQANAMANCRGKYSSCYAYSTSNGNTDWVQRISDNGGREVGGGGGGGGGYTPTATDIANIGSIIGSIATIAGGGGGGGYGGGYGGGGGGYGGGGGQDCSQYLRLANECRARYGAMGSLTGVGVPGTAGPTASTGQTGAFQACYNNYMNGYNLCMGQ